MIKTVLKKIYFALRSVPLRLAPGKTPGRIPREAVTRILVMRLDRIGDLVLSTPVFKVLRKHFPRAKISALVREQTADILTDNPYLDEVLIYPGFLKALFLFRKRFDLVLDLLMDYDLKPALLTALLKPAFSVGFDVESRGRLFTAPVPLSAEKKHFVEHLFDLTAPLGITVADEDRAPEIVIKDSRAAGFSPWLAENGISAGDLLISFHPGGFYPSQRWPWKSFAELAKRLLSRYPPARILLLGTAAENDIINGIYLGQDAGSRPRVLKMVNTRLLQAIHLIRISKLFIGNNSGLLHIAAALRIPAISSMGPTVPWLWRPYGDEKRNIVFRKGLECSPCSKGVCKSHECLNRITVDEVFEKAKGFLDQERRDR
ncbi:MAG: glycosyltransferase family 9 protein [Endomicrobiales bacterium]